MSTAKQSLTEKDKNEIVDKILSGIGSVKAECPHGIDSDTAAGLKDFVRIFNTSKRTAVTAFTYVVVIGTLSLIGAGLWAKIKGWLG